MRYVIIEDEKYAVENLKQIIRQIRPDYELVFESRSVTDSVAYLEEYPDIDVIFMDVELIDGNCFEIFSRVKVSQPIIFTTAYDEYAIKAFKVNSVDYLLKPITETDVETALRKLESSNLASINKLKQLESVGKMLGNRTSNRFLIFKGDNISFIEEREVAFFYSEDNYVYAYTINGQYHITTFHNLSELTDILNPDRYFQIARNVITSVNAITKISRYFRGRLLVTLGYGSNNMEIVVSANRRTDFLNWLGK